MGIERTDDEETVNDSGVQRFKPNAYRGKYCQFTPWDAEKTQELEVHIL